MSEFLNRRAGKAETADPIVSPVDAQALADWLVLDVSDPVLPALLKQATGAVVRYIGHDLLARDWTLTHWDWPAWGTMHTRNLGSDTGREAREIELPYGLISVDTVTRYGEEVTEFITRQKSIVIDGVFQQGTNTTPALVVEYRAGFGETEASVPDEIKQAILQLAGFNYEHRGSCDAMDATKRSGAAELLTPWRAADLLW